MPAVRVRSATAAAFRTSRGPDVPLSRGTLVPLAMAEHLLNVLTRRFGHLECFVFTLDCSRDGPSMAVQSQWSLGGYGKADFFIGDTGRRRTEVPTRSDHRVEERPGGTGLATPCEPKDGFTSLLALVPNPRTSPPPSFQQSDIKVPPGVQMFGRPRRRWRGAVATRSPRVSPGQANEYAPGGCSSTGRRRRQEDLQVQLQGKRSP